MKNHKNYTTIAVNDFTAPLMRTYYDGLQAEMSDRTATVVDLEKEPSLTKQEFADECDINTIMARFAKTGEILHVSQSSPRYGDFSSVPDYQTALHIVQDAEASFASLPSKIRDRFHNDPAEFLDFVSDPKNEAELTELGILSPPPPLAEDPAPEAPEPAPESSSTS